MPRFNIYIRNEDVDKWKALKSKPDFIHNALNNRPKRFPEIQTVNPHETKAKIIKTPQDAQKAVDDFKRPITYTKPFPTA